MSGAIPLVPFTLGPAPNHRRLTSPLHKDDTHQSRRVASPLRKNDTYKSRCCCCREDGAGCVLREGFGYSSYTHPAWSSLRRATPLRRPRPLSFDAPLPPTLFIVPPYRSEGPTHGAHRSARVWGRFWDPQSLGWHASGGCCMRIALATMDKTPHLVTTVGFVGNRSPTGRVVRLLFFGRWACSIRGAPQGAQPLHAGCGWRKNYHYDYDYDHDCDYGYAL